MPVLTERLSDDEAAALLAAAPWSRLVVLGDSVAEGIREPVDGWPDRGWVDAVAEALALRRPGFVYRNLGRMGLFAAEVRAQQLEPALAFEPDVAIVVAGGNDMLRASFDGDGVEAELDAMAGALRAAGSDVVTVGLVDISRASILPEPYRGPVGERLRELAARSAAVSARHGGLHVDLTTVPEAGDDGIWSSDGRHLNARGQAIAAEGTIRQVAAQLAARSAGDVRG